MLSANPPCSKLSIATLTFGLIAAFAVPACTQEATAIHVGNTQLKGLPDDWTHHHLVFHDPGTSEDAYRNGKYDEWFRIVNDPRYVIQQMKQQRRAQGSASNDVERYWEDKRDARDREDRQSERHNGHSQPALKGDWGMVLGGSGTTVGAGMYPAKFSFYATASSGINCANATTPDFVVYNTSAAGSPTQASLVAYDNIYATTCAAYGAVPSVYWAYNTGGTVVASVTLSLQGTSLAFVQTPSSGNAQLVLLKWAKTPAGHNVTSGGTNVTSGSKNFTATAGTPLSSTDVGAVISGTGIPAGDTIATVTSTTAGTLTTAATGNGTGGETLSISADAGSPATPPSVSNASFSTCTAPCMTTLSFSGSTRSDTISSPYYDYTTDTIYVGDASGGLHKFNPVFTGPPAEVGSPWASPSTTALTSPVYDGNSGKVFVGDASGYLYSVDSSATVIKSVQLANSPGIVDGPLVDGSNGFVYVTVSTDNSPTTGTNYCAGGAARCNGVIQLPTNFTASTTFNEDVMGIGTTTNKLFDGSFDNLYWTSTGVNAGTGNMYVAGSTGTPAPKLSAIPINKNVFQTGGSCASSPTKPPNSNTVVCAYNIANPTASATASGSPVTEFLNGSVDYIFTSVTASGNQSHCTGSCVYSWTVTSALTGTTADTAGATATGGASGIIVDNSSSTPGASQVYYSTLGNATCATSGNIGATGGCAIQASQSGLI